MKKFEFVIYTDDGRKLTAKDFIAIDDISKKFKKLNAIEGEMIFDAIATNELKTYHAGGQKLVLKSELRKLIKEIKNDRNKND